MFAPETNPNVGLGARVKKKTTSRRNFAVGQTKPTDQARALFTDFGGPRAVIGRIAIWQQR